VGFADDFVKVTRRRNRGLSGRGKLIPQFLVALGVAWAITHWASHGAFSTVITFPFLKRLLIPLGILYIPFVALVVVGSSNAVNLTDGLDGLAIGAIGIAAGTYAVLAYVTGNFVTARYSRSPSSSVRRAHVSCGPRAPRSDSWFTASATSSRATSACCRWAPQSPRSPS
jgi:phospho-N-acetylmuramoyl-pentapeptide-transferase